MAPKHRKNAAQEATPSAPVTAPVAAPAAPVVAARPTTPLPPQTSTKSSKQQQNQNWNAVVSNIVNHYVEATPQRTKLLDSFMAFLVAVGALQFLYCVLAGNYVRTLYIYPRHFLVGEHVLIGE